MHFNEAKNTSERAKKRVAKFFNKFSPLKLHRMWWGGMAIRLFPVAFHVANRVKL
jgi:hypothetical protein